jgi:hypothetical protein
MGTQREQEKNKKNPPNVGASLPKVSDAYKNYTTLLRHIFDP